MSFESSRLFAQKDPKGSTMFPFLQTNRGRKSFGTRNNIGQSLE